MKKVAICIPSGDHVHADFAMALGALTHSCMAHKRGNDSFQDIPIAICNSKGSLVVNNRNKLVHEALKLGVDYIFFLDTDIVMPWWTLRRLMSHDLDIVGATYMRREGPLSVLGKMMDGKTLDEVVGDMTIHSELMTEMGGVPTGCMLIKTSVFEGMKKPYFQTPAHAEEPDKEAWIEGEDYFFCRMARELGRKVWLDWGLSFAISHLGQKVNQIPTSAPEAGNAIIH